MGKDDVTAPFEKRLWDAADHYYTHLAESLPLATFFGKAASQSCQKAAAMGLRGKLVASIIGTRERKPRGDRDALTRGCRAT